MTALIASLLSISTAAEVFGTVTVWMNYQRGASMAAVILAEVADEREADDAIRSQFVVDPELLVGDMAPYHELASARARLRTLCVRVGNQLQRRWYTTAGLISYVAGAVVGPAAGFVALYR